MMALFLGVEHIRIDNVSILKLILELGTNFCGLKLMKLKEYISMTSGYREWTLLDLFAIILGFHVSMKTN